jgi:hypothetical protein
MDRNVDASPYHGAMIFSMKNVIKRTATLLMLVMLLGTVAISGCAPREETVETDGTIRPAEPRPTVDTDTDLVLTQTVEVGEERAMDDGEVLGPDGVPASQRTTIENAPPEP